MSDQQVDQPLRFAIYARTSTDMQELSIESQELYCRQAIAERNGVVVDVYTDSNKSGWSLDREGFNRLRRDAENEKFDAIMFWKFDRLARDDQQVIIIKLLLRHEYNLKLYCVEGYSEDDDESPYAAIMEQMLAIFSAFYSKNLSNETKRGKRQRALNGEFNGSIAPLGYSLVTTRQATSDRNAGLYIIPELAAIVRRAFELYATSSYSDAQIARFMNEQPEIQEQRAGRKPLDKEMVRDMLQNRVYTGRVCHADTVYSGALGQGKQSHRHRRQWFEGKHEGFISDELFDKCQEVRQDLAPKRNAEGTVRTYILQDLIYCARCMANKPQDFTDDNFGKMRPSYVAHHKFARYRCLSADRGYEFCGQQQVNAEVIDRQLIDILSNMTIPHEQREHVDNAVQARINEQSAVKRMAEIQKSLEKVNFNWTYGFIEPNEYLAKRKQLEMEIVSRNDSKPIKASDLLDNFRSYWDMYSQIEQPDEAHKELIQSLVERVLVYDDRIVRVNLHGNYIVDV